MIDSPVVAEQLRRDLPPWKIRDVIVGLLTTQLPLMALIILPNLLLSNTTPSSTTTTANKPLSTTGLIVTAILLFGIEMIFAIAPIFYARKRGRQAGGARIGFTELGFRGFNPIGAIGWVVLGYVIVIGASILYTVIVTQFHLGLTTNVQNLANQKLDRPLLILSAISAVVIAPICEELFFRGFVLQGLRKAMPAGVAVLVSSILFTAAHGDLGSAPLLFVSGLWMGFLRVQTRSIWPGVLFHTLNNAIAFTALLGIMATH